MQGTGLTWHLPQDRTAAWVTSTRRRSGAGITVAESAGDCADAPAADCEAAGWDAKAAITVPSMHPAGFGEKPKK